MESGTSKSKVKCHVGKYELGRTIGEGTFAKVGFAKNIETGEPVAIKILDKEKVLKHKLVDRLLYRHPEHRKSILPFASICSIYMNKSNSGILEMSVVLELFYIRPMRNHGIACIA
ncbi:hypothetical protein ZIOFF_035789 [Zingiber officinale]|uniref:Protein kinase domain-containing protein n=1 Tax=Zingiber officinale TaxID=94328 RepID=A0A8J5GF44_ZINOF|nr:hypothetical protein ZIOFF_035789 [Zingiber officinale]